MTAKKVIAAVVGVAVIAGAGFVGYKTWHNASQKHDFIAPPSLSSTGKTALERGEYLARAGDCVACHTAEGGKSYAGGMGLDTPFGKIMVSNITPDKETGIGGWSDQQFIDAVRKGKGIHGENLYPAMPYNVYSKVSDADLKDMKAYLDTIPAVHNQVAKTDLPFPFNIRQMMWGWNLLFFDAAPFKTNPQRSSQWNRGAYLVDGLGHCTSCHTPKNLLGADQSGKYLQGGELQGWLAPEITGNRRQGIGRWTPDQVVSYLGTGSNSHAVAAGPMGEAIDNSLQYMNKDDLRAMAEYLQSLPGSRDNSVPLTAAQETMQRGAKIYQDNCMACHKADGSGVEGMIPALAGNSGIQAPSATNVLRALMLGGQGVATHSNPTAAAMPEFAWKLDDQQLSDVATFIRNGWGNQSPAVNTQDVANARKSLSASNPLNNPRNTQ
ncbi:MULTISPECIES: cytochrome c [Hafnia]|uniref:cytochrome c n=1 Tax=Hafnia TaxID=568 RepID=UPI002FC90F1C